MATIMSTRAGAAPATFVPTSFRPRTHRVIITRAEKEVGAMLRQLNPDRLLCQVRCSSSTNSTALALLAELNAGLYTSGVRINQQPAVKSIYWLSQRVQVGITAVCLLEPRTAW
jgi:hypothetical protein